MNDPKNFQDKFNGFVKNYLIDAVIVLVAVIYTVRGFTTFEAAQKTWYEIIADSALYLVFANTVKFLMTLKGIQIGMSDVKFNLTTESYAKKLVEVSPKIDFLQDYCDYENQKNILTETKKVLFTFGVSHEAYLQWLDGAKFSEVKSKDLAAAHEAVKKIKIYHLKAQDLTSEGIGKQDYGFGTSINEFKTKSTLVNLAGALMSSFIFGFYTLKLIEETSWANLIWYGLQAISMILFGVLALNKAYQFIINDFRNRFIKKTNHLVEFAIWVEKHEKRLLEEKRLAEIKRLEEEKEVQANESDTKKREFAIQKVA